MNDWKAFVTSAPITTKLLASPVGRRLPARQWLVLCAVVLFVAAGWLAATVAAQLRQPTAPLAPRITYIVITATPQPTAAPTETPAPPSATPEPVVIVEPAAPIVQQCYSATVAVADARGYPLGVATGRSCASQAAAEQNAAALAEEMQK